MDRAEARAYEGPDHRVTGLISCVGVFRIPGIKFAVKEGKDAEALSNDFLLTNTVHNAVADTQDSSTTLRQRSTPQVCQARLA